MLQQNSVAARLSASRKFYARGRTDLVVKVPVPQHVFLPYDRDRNISDDSQPNNPAMSTVVSP